MSHLYDGKKQTLLIMWLDFLQLERQYVEKKKKDRKKNNSKDAAQS